MYLPHFNLLIGYMFSLVLISLQISLLYYMIYFSASDLKFKEVFTETHMSAIPWSYSSNPPKSKLPSDEQHCKKFTFSQRQVNIRHCNVLHA